MCPRISYLPAHLGYLLSSQLLPGSILLLHARLHLTIPNHLYSFFVSNSLRHNLVSLDSWPEPGPQRPVDAAQDEDTNTHDREDIVRVTIRPKVAIGWRDEWHDCQEDVAQQEDYCDGQPCAPSRIPWLLPLILQVDETSGDEAVDPGAGVSVEIDDEVVRRARRRGEKDDDCDEPVEEELQHVWSAINQ